MTLPLFSYGILEIPEVMEALTGRRYSSISASAQGYARFLLEGKIYPGMIPQPGQTTEGWLYWEVDSHSLAILDRFEDDIYVRQSVQVHTVEGKLVQAQAYLLPPEHRQLLTTNPWDPARFRSEYLTTYLRSCRTFHAQELHRAEANQ